MLSPLEQEASRQPFEATRADTFLSRVYAIMGLGLGVTALVALFTSSSPAALQVVVGNRGVFYGLVIAELLLVLGFTAIINRLSFVGAAAVFLLYAALNGLTLSVIFLAYTRSSIASTFFVTGGTFGAMSLYGRVTKRDLSGLGSFAMMGLIGLIIASIVNIFLHSPAIYWLTTFMGVIVFTGLTAYDTQRIKMLGARSGDERSALVGALMLYLDFINLFLYLLRIFGRRR